MKAYRNPSTDLLEVRDLDPETDQEIRLPNSPLFKRFAGGLGWLNPTEGSDYAKHWLVVVGEQEDGILSYFTEASGDGTRLAEECVNWKDQLLIDRFWCAENLPEMIKALRKHDGLCRYEFETNMVGRKVYTQPPETWPYFRPSRPLAWIIPVSPEIKADLLSGYEMLKDLQDKEKAVIRDECWTFKKMLKRQPPIDQVLEHPIIQAAIYVTTMMFRTKIRDSSKTPQSRPLYGNLRRQS